VLLKIKLLSSASSNGTFLLHMKHIIAPKDHMSDFLSYPSALGMRGSLSGCNNTSGAMYPGVPISVKALETLVYCLMVPKSPILATIDTFVA